MNNPVAYTLILLAVVAAFLARDIPRAWIWLLIGGASFVISSLFWQYGDGKVREMHPILTFTTDALVCLSIHVGAKEKWELGVFVAFLTSVFASLLRIGGFVPDNIIYASLLEVCNFAAILIIGGTGLMDLIGKHENSVFHPVRRRLHSPRDAA